MRNEKSLVLAFIVILGWMMTTMVDLETISNAVGLNQSTVPENNVVENVEIENQPTDYKEETVIVPTSKKEESTSKNTSNKKQNSSSNNKKEDKKETVINKYFSVGNYVGKDINDVIKTVNGKLNLEIEYSANANVKVDVVYQQSYKNEKVLEGSTLILYVSSGGWSNWDTGISVDILNNSSYEVQEKNEYAYRSKEYTSSSSSSLSGWTKYDEKSSSSTSAWSNWSTSAIEPSNSIEVETRNVKVQDEKTTYTYSTYASYNSSKSSKWTHFCPTHASQSFGGNWTLKSITQNTRASVSTLGQQCPCKGYIANQYRASDDLLYYYEQVNVIPATYRKEYRYRTMTSDSTYYFYRYTDWSTYSSVRQNVTSDQEERTRTLYRYRKIA